MLNMNKKRIFFIGLIMALILLAAPLVSAQALDTMPPPLDPQSWTLLRDTNWSNFIPNPVINWMTEYNPAGIYNPSRHAGEQNRLNTPIKGAILLVDFWDRPFIMTSDLHDDLLGWHLFGEGDTYADYLAKVRSGASVTKNPQRSVKTEAELKQFWVDFLNKKITDPTDSAYNFGVNIREFWRENSYGKWDVDLDAFGVYTLQGFEFEFGTSFNTWADFPPAFRRGATTGTSGARSIVNESIALANQDGVWLGDYDFFFIAHAGLDEGCSWLEFGPMQWAEGTDVPDELGVRAKMKQIEEILTADPEKLLALETTFTSHNTTTPLINGYNQNTELRDIIADIKAHKDAGTLADYEFKFPANDWNWANSYIGENRARAGTAGGPNSAPTRYMSWTSWVMASSGWGSSSGYSGTTVRNSQGANVTNVPYSQQGENAGMATYAHEFGHIVNLGDNYSDPYNNLYSPDTEPWTLMSRGSFGGPFGDHAQWTVPALEANTTGTNLMFSSKKFSNFYNPGEVLEFTVAQLKAGTPRVAEIVARNIPLANEYYPWLEDYGLVSSNYYKGLELTFDSANPDRATLVTSGYTWTRARA